jgi:hypothetical protein
MNIFKPKGFLLVGGVVLVVVGLLGYVLIGPTPDKSIFGQLWWFDPAENIAHLFLGVVALLAYYFLKEADLLKWLVAAVGILAIVVAAYNLGGTVTLLGATLESPMDLILHLVVGLWALYAAFGPGERSKKA